MRLLEVHLEVEDLERSLDLYRQLLPAVRVVRDPENTQIFLVLPDGTAFGLWRTGTRGVHQGQGGAHVHYAFQIDPQEYEELRRRLLELDLKPLEKIWQDGAKSLYFFDFDGHQGEFMTKDWGSA
jgi:catechol 2,3-dioxygenase-like lactoylglutathione lyase family enzyme